MGGRAPSVHKRCGREPSQETSGLVRAHIWVAPLKREVRNARREGEYVFLFDPKKTS